MQSDAAFHELVVFLGQQPSRFQEQVHVTGAGTEMQKGLSIRRVSLVVEYSRNLLRLEVRVAGVGGRDGVVADR
ncbi:MAG: hypothetical protein H0V41_11605 [Pseudonocardiales bacterium]|nr:hypothetical protein [Pseudonocardiales bacterium]